MSSQNNITKGKVTIAGFGPGNPELLTVKAYNALNIADIIFYDDLLDASYLDRFSAEKVYVGKRSNRHAFSQSEINRMLVESANAGLNVVRLKGGDPLIFGRGMEEYDHITREGVEAEIIPGISSAVAAAAEALVPLTSRGLSSSVAFLSGHDTDKLDVPLADTLVVFMGASNQKELAQLFIKKGYDGNTPVAVCHRVSFSDSDTRRYTLSSLSESNELLPSPSIMIVGQTAASRAGRTVRRWLYTGSRLPAWKNTDGALVHAPLVSIRADYSAEPANIFNCDSILFPGLNAVEHFFRYLAHHKIDLRAVLDKRLLALTPSASHALKGIGLYIDPEFEGSTEEGIFRINRWIKLGGEKVLLPCSSVGMPELISTLKGVNAQVDCLTLFEVIRNPRPVKHDLGMFSGVMFSSALSVSHFCELYGGFPQNMEYRFSDTGAKELFIQLSGTSESNSVSV